MTKEEFKKFSSKLPHQPGIYKYLDKESNLLYIGKAKDLFKRVSSYFNKEGNSRRINLMLSHTQLIDFTVVRTEQDALILENNLIKEFQPKYNILLKDGKTYPYICIKKERFPRIFSTRRLIKDGSEYLGPFSSSTMVKSLLELIKDSYQIRSCNFNLAQHHIDNKKYKVCLDYHIKKCKGPCEELQSEEAYNDQINQIRNILKGNIRKVINEVKESIGSASEDLNFEKAHELSETLNLLSKYQSKSEISSYNIDDLDVFAVMKHEENFYVNYLQIKNGSLLFSRTIEVKNKLDEEESILLAEAIYRLRKDINSVTKDIIVNRSVELEFLDIKANIPSRGTKKDLINLAIQNLRVHIENKIKEQETKKAINKYLLQMKIDLHLKDVPYHIECFDNSNIQGTSPVASCVVFKNGKPAKRDYRHFHVKTVVGPDDFSSMKEIVYRRYKRLLSENEPIPQLIVIDGGKGQLSSAVESLKELDLFGKVAVIGIAKRLEEIYYPNDSIPLYLDKKSMSLKLIQQLRNEAHRFAITFHRNVRDKKNFNSELEQIEGIGKKTVQTLLKEFRSIKKISEQNLSSLSKHIKPNKAELIIKYFNQEK
jgi:excinuclease ABC subunit C